MTAQERLDLIGKYRKSETVIKGKYIDLFPYNKNHNEAIVRLRNQEKSRYFLNQSRLLTLESQDAWFRLYDKRDDDIYWCICDKTGGITGTIRLYDIDANGSICEEGSFIIDEAHAMNTPYALESKILVFDFALVTLEIKKVINTIRSDNKNMLSIAKRMGFIYTKPVIRESISYDIYELIYNNYKKDYLLKTLDKWDRKVY